MKEPSYVRQARLAQQRFDKRNPVQLEIGVLVAIENFITEGPRKVTVWFQSIENSDCISVQIEGAIITTNAKAEFVLDKQEFKSLLKAGLRFDESLGGE